MTNWQSIETSHYSSTEFKSNQIKMQTPKEQIIELHTGKSIEEIEENNRIVKELITKKKNQIK